MDREEAKTHLVAMKAKFEMLLSMRGLEVSDVFDVAIEALSAEPCEDAISRQAVLDLIYNSWKHNGVGENYGELSIDALKALPPVTPKQKMGRWIKEKKHHKDDFQEFDYWDVRCSECGARKRIGWTNIRHCPMCGAKMSENPTGSNSEEESEDTE